MIRTHVTRTFERLALEGKALQGRECTERGASLVEYALLLVLIAMVCLAAVQFFGGNVNDSFSRTGSSITNAG